jgi:hypothetical protein
MELHAQVTARPRPHRSSPLTGDILHLGTVGRTPDLPGGFFAEALRLQLTLAQIGASILRFKSIFYCRFKYINVYIF